MIVKINKYSDGKDCEKSVHLISGLSSVTYNIVKVKESMDVLDLGPSVFTTHIDMNLKKEREIVRLLIKEIETNRFHTHFAEKGSVYIMNDNGDTVERV